MVVALSETEVPLDDNVVFDNYKVFYPHPTNKGFRLLLLIREDFAAKNNPTVIKSSNMEIWIKLDMPSGPLVAAAVYRQWGGQEEEELRRLHDSVREYSSTFSRLVVMGDLNLDLSRTGDPTYYRSRLLRLHMECLNECGFSAANDVDMSPTYYSHGTFDDGNGCLSQKYSVLDHVYHLGLPPPLVLLSPATGHDRPQAHLGQVRPGAASRLGLKNNVLPQLQVHQPRCHLLGHQC